MRAPSSVILFKRNPLYVILEMDQTSLTTKKKVRLRGELYRMEHAEAQEVWEPDAGGCPKLPLQ